MTRIQIRKSVLSIVVFHHSQRVPRAGDGKSSERVAKWKISYLNWSDTPWNHQEYKTWIMFFYLKTEKNHNHENLPSGKPEKTKKWNLLVILTLEIIA